MVPINVRVHVFARGEEILRDIEEDPQARLLAACQTGDLHTVEELFDADDVKVDNCDKRGRFALGEAARAGHMEIVRYLVEVAGANVNLIPTLFENNSNKHLDSAQSLALQLGRDDVVMYLSDMGANPNISGVFFDAALSSKDFLVSRMLGNDVQVDAEFETRVGGGRKRMTALEAAMMARQPVDLKKLISIAQDILSLGPKDSTVAKAILIVEAGIADGRFAGPLGEELLRILNERDFYKAMEVDDLPLAAVKV